MRRNSSEREEIIEREVAVADSIQAVGSNSRKAEFAGNGIAVDAKRISRERAGTHRAGVCTGGCMLQPRDAARDGFGVGQQEVRGQNRMRVVHGNFVGQEPTVDRKGALERVELSVGLTLEAPSP